MASTAPTHAERWALIASRIRKLDDRHVPVVEIASVLDITVGAVRAALHERDTEARDKSLRAMALRRRMAAIQAAEAAERAEREALEERARIAAEREFVLQQQRERERDRREARESADRDRAEFVAAQDASDASVADQERRADCRRRMTALERTASHAMAVGRVREAQRIQCGLHHLDLKLAGHSPLQTERAVESDGLPIILPRSLPLQSYSGSPAAACEAS